MTEVLLAVGTRKGLFIGRRRDGAWEFDESPYFNAQAVYSVAIDTRGRPSRGCWPAGTARTGARRSSTPTTWAGPGPSRRSPP